MVHGFRPNTLRQYTRMWSDFQAFKVAAGLLTSQVNTHIFSLLLWNTYIPMLSQNPIFPTIWPPLRPATSYMAFLLSVSGMTVSHFSLNLSRIQLLLLPRGVHLLIFKPFMILFINVQTWKTPLFSSPFICYVSFPFSGCLIFYLIPPLPSM